MVRKVANFVLFQIGWFACVLGGAGGWPWIGAGVMVGVIAVHFAWISADRRRDGLLMGFSLVFGAGLDSILAVAGFYRFSSPWPVAWLCPVWMAMLWPGFTTTLNASMAWMNGRYAVGAVFGALGGPAAYLAGRELGALSFDGTGTTLLAVGAAWGVAMPLLLAVNGRGGIGTGGRAPGQ